MIEVKTGTYITFGQKSLYKDGWVRVETLDSKIAQQVAEMLYPSDYSMIYNQSQFDPRLFPEGELTCIKKPLDLLREREEADLPAWLSTSESEF